MLFWAMESKKWIGWDEWSSFVNGLLRAPSVPITQKLTDRCASALLALVAFLALFSSIELLASLALNALLVLVTLLVR